MELLGKKNGKAKAEIEPLCTGIIESVELVNRQGEGVLG